MLFWLSFKASNRPCCTMRLLITRGQNYSRAWFLSIASNNRWSWINIPFELIAKFLESKIHTVLSFHVIIVSYSYSPKRKPPLLYSVLKTESFPNIEKNFQKDSKERRHWKLKKKFNQDVMHIPGSPLRFCKGKKKSLPFILIQPNRYTPLCTCGQDK